MGSQHLGYRGEQVLIYVRTTVSDGQRAPSYAMIAEHCGFASIADVCNVVRRLERRGHLRRCDTGSRHRQGWHIPVIELL